MKYGELPKSLGVFEVSCKEMMFYQYLPIKMKGEIFISVEPRLEVFKVLLGVVACDYIGEFGLDAYNDCYVYVTAKHLFQHKGSSFNRDGWHCDGFMTDDINYIWCDRFPTVFNTTEFNLTMDDAISLIEMENQFNPLKDFVFKENELLRLNQFNVHRTAPVTEQGLRTFMKVSFSKDKYDLIGNAHNYNLDYNWEMKSRSIERNIPQSILKI